MGGEEEFRATAATADDGQARDDADAGEGSLPNNSDIPAADDNPAQISTDADNGLDPESTPTNIALPANTEVNESALLADDQIPEEAEQHDDSTTARPTPDDAKSENLTEPSTPSSAGVATSLDSDHAAAATEEATAGTAKDAVTSEGATTATTTSAVLEAAQSSTDGETSDPQEGLHPSLGKNKFSVPEMPRWRFINQAKKTEGYSSFNAGSAVKGLSSKELVDKYKVPEWKIAHEELLHSSKDFSVKMDEKKATVVDNHVKEEEDIGKLNMKDWEENDVVEETFEFAGLQRKDGGDVVVQEDDEEEEVVEEEHNDVDSVKVVQWGEEDVPSVVDELATTEGERLEAPLIMPYGILKDVHDVEALLAVEKESEVKLVEDASQQQPDINLEHNVELVEEEQEEPPGDDVNELATREGETLEDPVLLKIPVKDEVIEQLALQVKQVEKDEPKKPTEPEIAVVEATAAAAAVDDDDELDQMEKQIVEEEEEPEQDVAVKDPEEDLEYVPPPPPPLSPSYSTMSPADDEEPKPKNKRRKCLLFLLVIVSISAVLGVVLGGKKSEDENDSDNNKALIAEDIESASDESSSAPTSQSPTQSPSTYCPSDTKLFAVQSDYVQQFIAEQSETWVVKDACSGKEMMRCLPCPNHDVASTLSPTPLPAASTPLPTLSFSPPSANPTNKPSVSPSSRTPPTASPRGRDGACIGRSGDRPRPVRDGERFRFNLLGGGDAGQCVDDSDRLYERGEFDDVPNFGECAERCVLNTPKSLAFNDAFRGYDYDCPSKSCYCIYDRGTLNNGNTKDFDSSSYGDLGLSWSEEYSGGTGNIAGVAYKVGYYGYYCGKLVREDEDGTEFPTYSPTTEEEEDVRQRLLQEDESGVERYFANSDGVSGCLPDGNEYVFEVRPSYGAGECCGFAPDSLFATYDDNIVVKVGSEATDADVDDESISGRTYFAERSEPCPSSKPSFKPSTTEMPSASPTQPIRNVVYPSETAMYPCRETVESEMAGRINGLSGAFCGFCTWKLTDFTCYQRVNFLVTQYDMTYVAARQSLLDRVQCTIPEDGVAEDMLERIERMAYCGNVPTISVEDAIGPKLNQI